ncbi:hypothetical protein ES703_93186 [subsurface metagenome]
MTRTKLDKELNQPKLKTIWFFLKPYKLQVVALFVLALVIGVLETATIAAIYPMVDVGLNIQSGVGQDNILLSLIATTATIFPLKDAFISYCVLIIILAIIVFIVKVFNVRLSTNLSTTVVRETKERIFEKQMKADYQYFLDSKQGGLVYTTTRASTDVMTLVTSVAKILSEILLMLFLFILLFSLNWKGASLIVLVAVVYYFITQYVPFLSINSLCVPSSTARPFSTTTILSALIIVDSRWATTITVRSLDIPSMASWTKV